MAKNEITSLRDFPSVEELLISNNLSESIKLIPRPLSTVVIREVIAGFKEKHKAGVNLTLSDLHRSINRVIIVQARKKITKVINGTGVVVHTNLGRAPLSEQLFVAIKDKVTGYTNVEFDLATGKRGSRGEACEMYLSLLAGSESSAIVNNCAAALLLILNTLANRKKVLISRGELVQIGGGFRIPDILKRSGAKLVEVGTTNVTSLSDYENEIEDAALVLKVHKSNFVQAGFTDEVSIADLSALCKSHSVPLVNDLGSGVFVPTKKIVGFSEPTVQMSVRSGADLTCFSGDKLLGGVQAGLIVGRSELTTKLKKNPIYRAVRSDKIVFAALEELLSAYLNDNYTDQIRLWKQLSLSIDELTKRAKMILKNAGNPEGLEIIETDAFVGGGSLPESAIKSVGLLFSGHGKATALMKKFRQADTPVIGRIENDQFIIDLRSLSNTDIDLLASIIKKLITE